MAAGGSPPVVPVEPVEVTGIEEGDDRISFDVDRVGEPVLVRSSYFPNWQASGADGPFRVTPNLMVVVPTTEHVELHYGWTPVDLVAWILTVLGVGGVVWLARRPDLDVPAPPEPEVASAEPDRPEASDGDGAGDADQVDLDRAGEPDPTPVGALD
jgi:hypothetical protein